MSELKNKYRYYFCILNLDDKFRGYLQLILRCHIEYFNLRKPSLYEYQQCMYENPRIYHLK